MKNPAPPQLILILDQISKYWVVEVFQLEARGSVPLAGPIWLSMVWNPGVSFGLLGGDNPAYLPLEVPRFGAALWEGLGGFSGRPVGWYAEQVPSLTAGQVARPGDTVLVCDHLG